MTYDFLYTVENSIATITLNRPEVLNALTLEIYAQLRDLFEDLRHDEAVKAVVITGAGRAFCSGGDVHTIIGEVPDRDMRGHLSSADDRSPGAQHAAARQPIVAAVNGSGGGRRARSSRWRVTCASSPRMRSCLPLHARRFDGADMGAAFPAARIVGQGRAMELLMLGDDVDAHTAERIGSGTASCRRAGAPGGARIGRERLANGPTPSPSA
jgi:enoyl-CoA hydratase/carnithine racemase